MKNLFVYHPGSGTLISLGDPVYVVSSDICSDADMEEFSMGSASEHFASLRGMRIDNYNIGHLFFGDPE